MLTLSIELIYTVGCCTLCCIHPLLLGSAGEVGQVSSAGFILLLLCECTFLLEMATEHERDKQIGQEEEEEEEEEEYVLLELDGCLHSNIQPDAPYILSVLDTPTPNLIVGRGVNMIGEYEETVGTYYLFSESDAPSKPVHDRTVPLKVNKDKLGSSCKEGPSKEVKHLASVQKILKFQSINEDHHEHRAYQHKDKEFSFDPSNRM
ncbi:general transcription factor 3C polypeptide 6-like isoform X1 [Triticum dicoccoides]|nr:general transcription factor 3C polypeptide 6-like isoform X1 [Triticum dicoccoides]XP_037415720.1 general transcription factor 3C polypeptide 6-like isoform X1 [Triticum dicoccoides]XP_037415721.1 general transcription factor 3C polypeptide 6-like isoform X1 [Triticum dicoccoides]